MVTVVNNFKAQEKQKDEVRLKILIIKQREYSTLCSSMPHYPTLRHGKGQEPG